MFKTILKPFASLTLTVILLALSMILIYAGTWAQIDSGIWQVQSKYFHSFFCWIDFQTIWRRPSPGQSPIRGGFPMLGGYTVGLGLLINLIAAHTVRFKFVVQDFLLLPLLGAMVGGIYLWHLNPSWWYLIGTIALGLVFLATLAVLHGKRTGIILIHLGLIVLLAGEGLTSGMASESNMTIDVGSYANYSQDVREPELAIVSAIDDKQDAHAVIAASMLKPGAVLNDPKLPFQIKVEAFYKNSGQTRAKEGDSKPTITDSQGTWTVNERPVIGGVVGNASDAPSAFVTLSKNGRAVGSYLATLWSDKPQTITVDGKSYDLSLRWKRIYHPYTVRLLQFTHELYTGTDVAKDFASHVILEDPARHETRDVRIWMNHPLRYEGDTLYQSSFKPGDRTTILQVVRNPGATMPYVAIIIAAIGLLVHFGIALVTFLSKLTTFTASDTLLLVLAVMTGGVLLIFLFFVYLSRRKREAKEAEGRPTVSRVASARGDKYELKPQHGLSAVLFPTAVFVVFAIYVLGHAMPHAPKSSFDLARFGALPISFDGRTQPIDSLARNTLKVISGRDTAVRIEKDDKGNDKEVRVSAIEWFLDSITARGPDTKYKAFRIDYPDIKDLIGANPKDKLFSVEDIISRDAKKIESAIHEAKQVDPKERSQYQAALSELGDRISLYMRVQRLGGLFAVPPLEPGEQWRTLSEVARDSQASGVTHPTLEAFVAMDKAYSSNNPGDFNRALGAYDRLLQSKNAPGVTRVNFETWFNSFDPVMVAMAIYVAVFVFGVLSWLGWSIPLQRSALALLLLALGVHTCAIISRIYISGRPPVTNLANSSIFIAWGAAVFCVVLEVIFRRGIGSVAAGFLGFVTLLIYHELSLEGDTMKVLQAVLDTNIWLATHVVIITLGYAATFLAWILGVLFILLGMFTNVLTPEWRKTVTRMTYGVTCFAIICSFVGTILGGIWADQSWGRFWGWDPKENGAVMIVLANAILLHARWGGLVKERGIAVLAVFGGIITAWSWFGTNMLGVGFHSYGFMDSALTWLLIFVGSQAGLMLMACLPFPAWASYRDQSVASGN